MLYSQLFGKTRKNSKEFDSVNATLLIKGGFIDQEMAGVYTFLPLGFKVLNKIENIIREEMDKIGTELFMPSISPWELWETTGRAKTMDVLYKAEGANEFSQRNNDAHYILNSTHEEVITPIAKKFNASYKDLPFAVYQIQSKFRNEVRPKSGLLRGREFRMKDLYSFHKNEEELKEYYEVVKKAYFKIFERLGIGKDTYFVAASGGDFTKDYSHEFQTKCETGEDTVFLDKKTGLAFNKEVAPAKSELPTQDKTQSQMKEVFGKGVAGVEDLCKFLNIPAEKTTKTLVYQTEKGVVATSVRGDYTVNEYKLKRVAGVEKLELANEETVIRITGAEIGYAGILNLPKDIRVYLDDSIENLVNFETGGNKTNYHVININWGRDLKKPEKFYDIKMAKEGDLYPRLAGERYEVFNASEVGNIFPLNTKFSEAFGYYYTDKDGSQKIVYMGSYGLGSSRVMGVLVEKFHDENGIIWPENVAPFKVHLIGLNLEDKKTGEKALSVYNKLLQKNIEVLFDDRDDISAGEKFSDSDLIGIPYRVVVSQKTGDKVEIKRRNKAKAELLTVEKLLELL